MQIHHAFSKEVGFNELNISFGETPPYLCRHQTKFSPAGSTIHLLPSYPVNCITCNCIHDVQSSILGGNIQMEFIEFIKVMQNTSHN